MASIKVTRLMKELKDLENCKPIADDHLDILEAKIIGEPGTPYENGTFILRIEIPERYPFEPPKVRFMTKIYHPNIDKEGRICLDLLKTTSETSWKPTFNISTVLGAIKVLMAEPNPDDPLEENVAEELLMNKEKFLATARVWSKKYASGIAQETNRSEESRKDHTTEDIRVPGTSGEITTAKASSNDKPIGKSSVSGRMRSMFSSMARTENAMSKKQAKISPGTDDAVEIGQTTMRAASANEIDSAMTTPKKCLMSTQGITASAPIKAASSTTPPIATSIPERCTMIVSPNASVNKSSRNSDTKLGCTTGPKSVDKPENVTPKGNNPKKKKMNSAGEKKEISGLSRQQKRPRFEDLFLNEEDDDLDFI